MEFSQSELDEMLNIFKKESSNLLEKTFQILDRIKKDPQDNKLFTELFRNIHGLKGACSAINFKLCEKKLHKIEDEMKLLENKSSIKHANINKIFEELNFIKNYINYSKETTNYTDTKSFFNLFENLVQNIANKNNKKVQLIIKNNLDKINENIVSKITNSLIQILKNAVTHGIETPDFRIRLGKPEIGTIFLELCQTDKNIIINITNDGEGISPQKIRQKALENGIYSENTLEKISDKEIINLIFNSNFSTNDRIEIDSGRGFGLDIVKKEIDELDGEIKVTSNANNGSTFSITIPISKKNLRTFAKQARKNINIKNLSEKLCKKISENEIFKKSKHIMIFYPLKNEIDLRDLLKNEDKNFYLPRIFKNTLEVCPYSKKDTLKDGLFKTKEPINESISNKNLDLIIVPALIIDKNNFRLGYGKGYYDKFLEKTNTKTMCAISKELICSKLPLEAHDKKIDIIIAE